MGEQVAFGKTLQERDQVFRVNTGRNLGKQFRDLLLPVRNACVSTRRVVQTLIIDRAAQMVRRRGIELPQHLSLPRSQGIGID